MSANPLVESFPEVDAIIARYPEAPLYRCRVCSAESQSFMADCCENNDLAAVNDAARAWDRERALLDVCDDSPLLGNIRELAATIHRARASSGGARQWEVEEALESAWTMLERLKQARDVETPAVMPRRPYSVPGPFGGCACAECVPPDGRMSRDFLLWRVRRLIEGSEVSDADILVRELERVVVQQ